MIPGLCSLFYPGKTIPDPSFSASTSPSYVAGGTSIGSATTASTTAMPLGGVGPYTYAWSYAGGDPSMSINAPAAATTNFTAFVNTGDDLVSTFTCVITDSNGATGSASVTAELVSTNAS